MYRFKVKYYTACPKLRNKKLLDFRKLKKTLLENKSGSVVKVNREKFVLNINLQFHAVKVLGSHFNFYI